MFIFIASGSKEVFLAKESSVTFSRHLLILERMVIDHLKMYYKDSLDRACISKK